MSGVFIVFEGGDGVGKSTQVGRLVETLTQRGFDVCRTYEPGDSLAGKAIRALLLDPATGHLADRAETLLYAADKAQHIEEVVAPALARGRVVVSDRYVDSMLAYQGARGLDRDHLNWVARWATSGLKADLTVLLDMDPAGAVDGKESKDRIEGAGGEFHRRARQIFLDLAAADPDRYLVVAARRGIDEIADEVATRVADLLAAHECQPQRAD